ncbi:hypothetical protein GW17_00022843 [Ensete ventricosum]|nr:hypothetical protein GW17_00022843 [Ensete ventricosum]
MALFDRVHDVGRVITSMDNKVDLLRREVQRLKEGGDPEAMAAAEGQASEAQSLKEVQVVLLVPKILRDSSAATEESHGLVLAECASSSTSIGNEGVRLESVQCLGSLHLGWASLGTAQGVDCCGPTRRWLSVHSALPPPLPRVWPPCMMSQSAQKHGTRVWRAMRHLWHRLADPTSDADVAMVLMRVCLPLGC